MRVTASFSTQLSLLGFLGPLGAWSMSAMQLVDSTSNSWAEVTKATVARTAMVAILIQGLASIIQIIIQFHMNLFFNSPEMPVNIIKSYSLLSLISKLYQSRIDVSFHVWDNN
ncbi:hypothetical protein FGO68_gene2451 [Halteria grandinella]|uniref:Uncharacterized protein n=1 Tax=Halteria grandinella TaxID=5974 RepID=A0A8J8P0L1_HALGN|nr:hypothetical protein FGO68_gene2451 [Halteria grandinella]